MKQTPAVSPEQAILTANSSDPDAIDGVEPECPPNRKTGVQGGARPGTQAIVSRQFLDYPFGLRN